MFAISQATARVRAYGAQATWVALVSLAACPLDPNQGVTPPEGEFFFPNGLLLPVFEQGQAPPYLFVSNGNNDLTYNAGTIDAIDLNGFFALWQGDDGLIDPTCTAGGRCVGAPGAPTTARRPCRRLALFPQVVECDEGSVVASTAQVGNFVTSMAVSHESSGVRLWAAVRQEPNLTFIDLSQNNATLTMDCGQNGSEPCASTHRLTHARNDTTLARLPREPFTLVVDETTPVRYLFAARSSGPAMTVVDLDGLPGTSRPAIVETLPLFQREGIASGGFGVAVRPCAQDNAPSITLGCERPLVYGSFRFDRVLTRFSVSGLHGLPTEAPAACIAQGSGPYCATPAELGDPCAVICEPRVISIAQRFAGGLDPTSGFVQPILGDMAYAPGDLNTLYILQTSPGALLRFDTSLDVGGEPRDAPLGVVAELCEEPTKMAVTERFAYVTCFRAALVYVVDLQAGRVVSAVVVGTGPHGIAVDEVRNMVFVANTLESSVSVLDVGPTRATYLREVARIGLQEPFSQ